MTGHPLLCRSVERESIRLTVHFSYAHIHSRPTTAAIVLHHRGCRLIAPLSFEPVELALLTMSAHMLTSGPRRPGGAARPGQAGRQRRCPRGRLHAVASAAALPRVPDLNMKVGTPAAVYAPCTMCAPSPRLISGEQPPPPSSRPLPPPPPSLLPPKQQRQRQRHHSATSWAPRTWR